MVDSFNPDSSNATALQLAQRFWGNIRGVVIDLGEAVSDSRGFWQYKLRRYYHIPLLLLGGGILVGLVVLVRQGEVFIPVYIVMSVLLLCVTPWPEQFRRYLTPMMPFLLVSLFSGVLGMMNWIRMVQPSLPRIFSPVALGSVLVLIAYAEVNALLSMYRWHLDPVTSETRDGSARRLSCLLLYGRLEGT